MALRFLGDLGPVIIRHDSVMDRLYDFCLIKLKPAGWYQKGGVDRFSSSN